jgi:outer membrane murein-binding lipoprotein Lpp
MTIKNRLLIAGAASSAILLGGGVAATRTLAADTTSTNPMDSLVTRLSEKFNLNKSDVQAVFDENRTAMETKHQQEVTDRLTQAVTDGKLTEAQKTAILAEHEACLLYTSDAADDM